jgi:hypothetical protein
VHRDEAMRGFAEAASRLSLDAIRLTAAAASRSM